MYYQQKFKSLGLNVPSILLPQTADLQKWSVIACDQFTQDRDYWEKIKSIAGDAPSALNLIFPEAYLSDSDAFQRIAGIHANMNRYLQDGVFVQKQGFIYIERDTPRQKKRKGLVAAIDLEHYDWRPDERPLIRCTEGTVPERLPVRMDIRRGAPLEIPHILLLIDDDTDSLLTQLGEKAKKNAPCYSTQLMMNSGSITGWFLDVQDDMSFISDKLDELYRCSTGRYDSGGKPFLFAVGDGNHSLAAAKGIWEEYKAENIERGQEEELHPPCRYALVEIENIYDPAVHFEPIHRLVFGLGFDKTVSLLSQLPDFTVHRISGREELVKGVYDWRFSGQQPGLPSGRLSRLPSAANRFGVISQGCYALIETSAAGIATACLQPLLDSYAKDNPQLIDYIHDEEELFRLSSESRKTDVVLPAAGILLPPVQKSGLFETVARLGPLPRKSFSMGNSAEKRFYLECRAL
jgi:hypothetical protein